MILRGIILLCIGLTRIHTDIIMNLAETYISIIQKKQKHRYHREQRVKIIRCMASI